MTGDQTDGDQTDGNQADGNQADGNQADRARIDGAGIDGTGTTAPRNRVGPRELGLDLRGGGEPELFKWLAACVLFGARIKQELAASAYAVLDREGVLTPATLAGSERQRIVDLLREGRYRRYYDETKADELIQLGRDVGERYGGHLSRLREEAGTPDEIRRRLRTFRGIGPTAAGIFLREAGPDWAGPSTPRSDDDQGARPGAVGAVEGEQVAAG